VSGTPKTVRKGVTPARIVDVAIELLDQHGLDGLTTKAIAAQLHVSQPTLYSHIENLDEVRTLVAIRGMDELGHRVHDAIDGAVGIDAITKMAIAYREFVRDHPAVYMLQQSAPVSAEYWRSANAASDEVRQVFRQFGLDSDRIRDVHLVFRASVLGFVNLELNEALRDVDHDDNSAFALFLEMFSQSLSTIRESTIE
jgi:AcrR family transcriptional regulator